MRELRNKFIKMFMLVVVLVMVFFGVLINVTTFFTSRTAIHTLLEFILDNEGAIPESASDDQREGRLETEFGSGYRDSVLFFTVTIGENGEIEASDTGRISDLDEQDAQVYAQTVSGRFFEFGAIDDYYYLLEEQDDGTVMIAFADSSTQMRSTHRILFMTVLICAAGLIITYLCLRRFSWYIIKPEMENMRRQNQFITNASHELKTPLAVIRANMEVEEMLNGESEWTQSTVRQVERMDGLIQNLVMISRSQEAEGDAQPEKADISRLVEETAEPFTSLALQDHKGFTLAIAPDIEMVVTGSLIRQMTSILVDNALKYCDEGGTVTVTLAEKTFRKGPFGKEEKVCLTVSNSYAAGRDVDYSRFFERFYREDESHNADKGGYGIGLSVAESICRQLHGSIEAQWKDGVISFICTLPFRREELLREDRVGEKPDSGPQQ